MEVNIKYMGRGWAAFWCSSEKEFPWLLIGRCF